MNPLDDLKNQVIGQIHPPINPPLENPHKRGTFWI